MFKTLILVFILGFSGFLHQASAQPVRVLISISKDRISERFSNKVYHKLIRNGFSEEDFSITQDADQHTLYQSLNDPQTQALIWISHGATPRLSRKMKRQIANGAGNGMSAQPELVDYRGDNVAPVFKKYSKNIRYVAVVGCNSQEILDYVGSGIATDDAIEKYIPTKKIIAQFAIRKVIKQLSNIELLDSTTAEPMEPIQNTISITRTIPSDADSDLIRPLRIMIGNELMGVLPALQAGETRTWQIPVSEDKIKQVKLETGQNIMTDPTKINFGDLKITLPDQTSMKIFSKTDGTPFGLNFRLFILP